MPAQAQALVKRIKSTPVSADPLKAALLFNWGAAGPDEPLQCPLSLPSAGLQGSSRGVLPAGTLPWPPQGRLLEGKVE